MGERAKGAPSNIPPPPPAKTDEKEQRLGPKFTRLREVLARDEGALELRADPTALAPETIIVFELTGALRDFSKAVDRVPGLRFIGQEDGAFEEGDEDENSGELYLTVPDAAALQQILRMWDLHNDQKPLGVGHREWTAVFQCLHDVRRWGPRDRVTDEAAAQLLDAADGEFVRVELELMVHRSPERQAQARNSVKAGVTALGGEVLRSAQIPEIAYDALLVSLPTDEVRAIAERGAGTLAEDPEVFAIRPQSFAQLIPAEDAEEVEFDRGDVVGDPIIAILDAVPVANHSVLSGRLIVHDPDGLSERSVGRREHGTAMSSLVIWGDLKADLEPQTRPVLLRPVMFASAEHNDERFPNDSLVVDDIVRAVRDLLDDRLEDGPAAPSVVVVSISLGDITRPFSGRMSPWARALDWLSSHYGVLFLVSAGNISSLTYNQHLDEDDFLAVVGEDRTRSTLEVMRNELPHRRIISPGEAVNVLTVGAAHDDLVNGHETVGNVHDLLPTGRFPSPASRHGPGYRNSVKPDLLALGGRIRARSSPIGSPPVLKYGPATSNGGLQVAGSNPSQAAWSGYTSAATALTSRAAGQLYDALDAAYGEAFSLLPRERKALILKALLVHRASVPDASRDAVLDIFGPANTRLHHQRSANVRRLFGYGFPAWDEVQACLLSRATLWGQGVVGEDEALTFNLPLPASVYGNRTPRRVTATLSWFSPIEPGMRDYKAVRLQIEEPDALALVGVKPQKGQTQKNESLRGTTFHRSWSGQKLIKAVDDGYLPITVSRKPDTAEDLPGATAFGLVVTLESEGGLEVYDSVRARLAVQPRISAPVAVPVPARL